MSPVGTGFVFVKQILYAVCEKLLSVSPRLHLLFPSPACLTDSHTHCLTRSLSSLPVLLTHSLTHSLARCHTHSLPHSLPHASITHSLPLFLPASCGRQRPTEAKVEAIVAKEKWETNVPSLSDVLQAWVSPLKAAIEDDEDILKSVVEQKWKGINFKDFGQPKGRGEGRQKSTVQTFLQRLCHGSKITAVYVFVFLFRSSAQASSPPCCSPKVM